MVALSSLGTVSSVFAWRMLTLLITLARHFFAAQDLSRKYLSGRADGAAAQN